MFLAMHCHSCEICLDVRRTKNTTGCFILERHSKFLKDFLNGLDLDSNIDSVNIFKILHRCGGGIFKGSFIFILL